MNIVLKIVLILQVLSAIGMVGLILVQHGKGADMGAAFGSGGSGSLFGASGSANFMSRATSALAAVFFVCTLALSYFGNLRPSSSGSVLDGAAVVTPVPAIPVAPAGPAAQIPGNTPALAASVAPTTPAATPAVVPVDVTKPATQIPAK
jgi:preprotein translocase subunit SecG